MFGMFLLGTWKSRVGTEDIVYLCHFHAPIVKIVVHKNTRFRGRDLHICKTLWLHVLRVAVTDLRLRKM